VIHIEIVAVKTSLMFCKEGMFGGAEWGNAIKNSGAVDGAGRG
jgi:hypothetical protein